MKSCIVSLFFTACIFLPAACDTGPGVPKTSGRETSPEDQHVQDENDRIPAVAGSFYPASETKLTADLKAYFETTDKVLDEKIQALIVPHAGYVFSGTTAAAAIKQLDRSCDYERIFLIGSSHTMYFRGGSIYTRGHFITPLGSVKIDPLAEQLARDHKCFTSDREPHRKEHSLEVQLPFLQYWLDKDFTIVPIILGGENLKDFQEIADALKPWFNGKNLFIISSDFSHYPNYDDAIACDYIVSDAILSNSQASFLKAKKEVESSRIPGLVTAICGWTSVYTLLLMTGDRDDLNFTHLLYQNSGDSPYGSTDRVVGYNAIAVSKEIAPQQAPEFTLNDSEKIELLKIARKTVEGYISTGQIPSPGEDPGQTLKTPAGAFVTLRSNNRLRGCIGNFQASTPLYKTVQDMAMAAATRDSRFQPVRASEIPELEIEISVLTPMKKIRSVDEIELGKHGIYIVKGAQTGTFLPQVAEETGWTLEEFLGHCSRDKAGIGWEGWKSADIYIYEALVFSEHEFDLP